MTTRGVRLPLALAVLVLWPAGPETVVAAEPPRTGRALQQACLARANNAAQKAECHAIVLAAQRWLEREAAEDRDHAGYCPPHGAVLDDLVRVYLAWAGENLASLADPAEVAARHALADAFPCAE